MLWKKIAETLMNESDSVAYVADMHTFELQYMNAHTKKLFGLEADDTSYIGQKCYKLLQGMEEPCSFCKNPVMSRNSFYRWEHFNPLLQEHYLVRDKIITVEGKDYHLQLAKLKENVPECLGVIYLDLNGLKVVNDTLGHAAGDALIQTAAKKMRKAFGKNTFRIGGDEFVALVRDMTEQELQEAMSLLRADMSADNVKVSVGVSYRDESVSVEEQMSLADKAMYAEKKAHHREA